MISLMYKSVFVVLILMSSPLLQASDSNSRVIAFAQDTMANDFRKAQVFEVRDEISKYPELSFVYSDAQGQTSLMIHQIDQFIKQKVDLLIVGTNDETTVVPVITKAYKSGIPVIILDRGIQSTDYSTFINSDNIEIGRIGAAYIAEKLKGKGLVLLFEGIQEADVTQYRSKGFLDEMKKHKGIKIIKRTGNYLRKDAVIEMEKILKLDIHVDAIFSESDSMLSGVRLVLLRNKIDPASIIMVGVDFTSEAQRAIQKGSQTASILFPLGGIKSIEVALKILRGETVEKHITNPVELITKENVDVAKPIF